MKKTLTYVLILLLIPAVTIGGAFVFRGKYHAWLALCAAVLSCLPFFYAFERRESTEKEITILAVMTAISVAGRIVFFAIPGFKPVTAVIILTAVSFGGEAGFLVGSLSALVSNFYFGQGPWTPFQMFAWGFIGFGAGILGGILRKRRWLLYLYGAMSGVFFSFTMDIWTVLWADGTPKLSVYLAALTAAVPITVEYAVSNVIFLALLAAPVIRKLERVRRKEGLFRYGLRDIPEKQYDRKRENETDD